MECVCHLSAPCASRAVNVLPTSLESLQKDVKSYFFPEVLRDRDISLIKEVINTASKNILKLAKLVDLESYNSNLRAVW